MTGCRTVRFPDLMWRFVVVPAYVVVLYYVHCPAAIATRVRRRLFPWLGT